MFNFYGRKSPRKVNKSDLLSLFDYEFFFHHKNIKNFNKISLGDSILNLEIGFGLGENIFRSALKARDEFFLGCDPYLKGSLTLKKQIKQYGVKNLILTNLSFQEFFEYINKYTFSKILILFPDPWPKRKHMKRRIIGKTFLRSLYTICNKNTKIIISSDDVKYVEDILYKFYMDENYILSTSLFGKKLINSFDLVETKYYKKAKKNKKKTYFFLYNVKT